MDLLKVPPPSPNRPTKHPLSFLPAHLQPRPPLPSFSALHLSGPVKLFNTNCYRHICKSKKERERCRSKREMEEKKAADERQLQLAGSQPPRPNHKGLKWLIVVGLASVQYWAPLLSPLWPLPAPTWLGQAFSVALEPARQHNPEETGNREHNSLLLICLAVLASSFLLFITNWSSLHPFYAN